MKSRMENILEKVQSYSNELTLLPKNLTSLITTIEKNESDSEAFLAVGNIRKLLLPLLMKPNYKNLHFLPIAYDILIEIAEKYPLNDVDPISREGISPEKSVVTSTGHIFNAETLLEYFQSTLKPINLLTNEEFNVFDAIGIICHLYKFQKINEEKTLGVLFNQFVKLIEKNDIFLLEFFLDKTKISDDLLKQLCSFGLCYIAQHYDNKMELFDLLYKNAQFHPDHTHHFAEPISFMSISIYFNGEKISLPHFESLPLIGIASRAGNHEVTKYMLQVGASIKPYITKDGNKRAPLFDVIQGEKIRPNKPVSDYGYGTIVELLLQHGARIDLTISGISAKKFASPNFLEKINYYIDYIGGAGPFNIFSPQCHSEIQNYTRDNQPQYSITTYLLSYCSQLWTRANNGNLAEEDIQEARVQNN